MIKLCYNSNGLRNISLIEAIKAVADAEYDGLEISLHEAHLQPFSTNAETLGHLSSVLESQHLKAVCLATGASTLLSPEAFEPSLISPLKEERDRRIALIKRSIQIARMLSIPVVNFASGIKRDTVTDPTAWRYLVNGVAECLAVGGDITLAIEPEPGFFIQTTAQAIGLIEHINSRRFMLNLDVGHIYCCEPDYVEAIRRALPYTRHIHIEDIKDGIHHHEIPGEGDIDLKAVLSVIKNSNYTFYVSVELYHHADVWERAITLSRRNLISLMSGI